MEHDHQPQEEMPAFGPEFRRCWALLPDKTFFLLLLAAWMLLFQFFGHSSFNFAKTPSLFEWMYNAYNAEALDSAHGQLIPFLILGLLWSRRDALLQSLRPVWWPALFILFFALALHLLGFFAQQPRLSIIAFYLGLYGLCGLAWGTVFLRETFFPFILFLFAIPLGTFVEPLTFWLRIVAVKSTFWVANNLLDVKLTVVGTKMLDAHGTPFEVAAACSGIRSFFALLLISLVYAMTTFKNRWRRTTMVLLTIPLALVCNIFRLTVVIVSSQAYGPKFAYKVHDWFWIVTYTTALICLFVVAKLLRENREGSAP